MRILFYHAARGWSGGARAFADAARGLAARGHQVSFACASDSQVEHRLDHAAYEVLPMLRRRPWPRSALRLREVLTLRQVEVIFVHTDREQIIASAASRMSVRAAVVRRVGAGDTAVVGPKTRIAMRLAPTGWLFALEDDLRKAPHLSSALPEPMLALPGIDSAQYQDPRSTQLTPESNGSARTIVCMYDAESRVRAAVVLRTIAMLAPLHPDLDLVMVGPGSDGEDLQMHAAALGITNRVSFLGERDDYISILRAAELGWVVCSGDDAVYAYLDLLALRVPVLAVRDAIAQRYVANGITGLLLAPGDTAGTAAALARLLAHDDEREAMGNAARVRVAREFTLDALIDGFERAAMVTGDPAERPK
ncbi:MAG: glycosyltransferase family 4 protein [Anaerolineae bacterium]|nr:glycosyltransferase family 4 protein [Gemmatimonadaceae bacterium]